MPSRRDQISMESDEQEEFLAGEPFGVLATLDPKGFPHLVNIGFCIDGLRTVYMTSFANAQKVRNVRRCDQASILIERTVPYGEICGVLLRGRARVVETSSDVADWYTQIKNRTAPLLPPTNLPPVDDSKLIAKRVVIALDVDVERTSSWDHRKLNGVY
jgi:nitroimidazol reductase NimA-like FMN-containing flavoprotein (pyridoxamine 5'-phosphate oxidase superfamily)